VTDVRPHNNTVSANEESTQPHEDRATLSDDVFATFLNDYTNLGAREELVSAPIDHTETTSHDTAEIATTEEVVNSPQHIDTLWLKGVGINANHPQHDPLDVPSTHHSGVAITLPTAMYVPLLEDLSTTPAVVSYPSGGKALVSHKRLLMELPLGR